ncbi:hypothetical protein ACJMK2_000017, partial [Sinanodonta woodiana]
MAAIVSWTNAGDQRGCYRILDKCRGPAWLLSYLGQMQGTSVVVIVSWTNAGDQRGCYRILDKCRGPAWLLSFE